MNDQVAELLVVVDLKLRKEAHGITMDSNAFGQRDDAKKKLTTLQKINSFENSVYILSVLLHLVVLLFSFTDLYLSGDGVGLDLCSLCSLWEIKATCLVTAGNDM